MYPQKSAAAGYVGRVGVGGLKAFHSEVFHFQKGANVAGNAVFKGKSEIRPILYSFQESFTLLIFNMREKKIAQNLIPYITEQNEFLMFSVNPTLW